MRLIRFVIGKYNNLSVEIKAAFWFTVCSFLSKGIKFLTEMIFSRILPESQYGLLSVYNAWTEILFILATLRLSAGVYQRGLLQYKKNKYQFTVSLMALSSVVCLFFSLSILLFSKSIEDIVGFSSLLLAITVVHFIFQVAYELWMAEQRFDYKYKAVVATTVIVCILGTSASILGVQFIEKTAEVKILCQVISDSLVFAVVGVIIFAHYKHETRSNQYKRIDTVVFWKYALAFNLPLIPHYLSQTVLNQSDRIMIGKLVSSSKAGIYSVAYTVGMVIQILQNSIFLMLQPWRYKNMENEKYAEIDKISRRILLLFGIVDVAFMSVAPEIIRLCFKPIYQEATDIVPAIALSSFYMFLYSYFGNIEFYFKKTKFTMVSSVSCAILNIILNYYGIKFFGYKACAYSTLMCYLLYSVAHYYAMKHICKKEIPGIVIYEIRKIVWICILVSGGAGMIRLLYPFPAVRFALIAFLALLLYFKRDFIKNILNAKRKG